MRLLCLFGLHRRIGRSVRRASNGWIGECRRCGKVITKPKKGRWRRATEEEIEADERYRKVQGRD